MDKINGLFIFLLGLFCVSASAQSQPVMISGNVNLINRDTAIAVDQTNGTALVVWNQSSPKKQEFGRIWGVQLTRDNAGNYSAGDPFIISPGTGSHQRPSVQFIDENKNFLVVWDTGPREPADPTWKKRRSRIMTRFYTPGAGLSAPVTLIDFNTEVYFPELTYDPGTAGQVRVDYFERVKKGFSPASVGSGRYVLTAYFVAATIVEFGFPELIAANSDANKIYCLSSKEIFDKSRNAYIRAVVCFKMIGTPPNHSYEIEYRIEHREPNLSGVQKWKTSIIILDVEQVPGADEDKKGKTRRKPSVKASGPKEDPNKTVTVATDKKTVRYEPDKKTGTDVKEKATVRNESGTPVGQTPRVYGVSDIKFNNVSGAENHEDLFILYHVSSKGKFKTAALNIKKRKISSVKSIWKVKKYRVTDMTVGTYGKTALAVWSYFSNRKQTKSQIFFGQLDY